MTRGCWFRSGAQSLRTQLASLCATQRTAWRMAGIGRTTFPSQRSIPEKHAEMVALLTGYEAHFYARARTDGPTVYRGRGASGLVSDPGSGPLDRAATLVVNASSPAPGGALNGSAPPRAGRGSSDVGEHPFGMTMSSGPSPESAASPSQP